MSEGLRKATEKCAELEARANAAYDKITEAKASYEFLGALASQAREILAMCLESDGAAATAPVVPKAVPAPAPVKPARPKRAPASEESDRQRQPNVRVDALAEFKKARDGITPSQMVATLRVRRHVTTAQVQTAFDYLAKKGQIEPYPDGEHGAWRHVDHRPKAGAELAVEDIHYADDGGDHWVNKGRTPSNGSDEDYVGRTSDEAHNNLIDLLDKSEGEGLTPHDLETRGVAQTTIEDAVAAHAIYQENGRYYAAPEG